MKVVGRSYGRGCTLVHVIYVITIKHTVIGVIRRSQSEYLLMQGYPGGQYLGARHHGHMGYVHQCPYEVLELDVAPLDEVRVLVVGGQLAPFLFVIHVLGGV